MPRLKFRKILKDFVNAKKFHKKIRLDYSWILQVFQAEFCRQQNICIENLERVRTEVFIENGELKLALEKPLKARYNFFYAK